MLRNELFMKENKIEMDVVCTLSLNTVQFINQDHPLVCPQSRYGKMPHYVKYVYENSFMMSRVVR